MTNVDINIDIVGLKTQLTIEKSSFVTFKSLLALKEKFSVVLINRTIIKPSMPKIGINNGSIYKHNTKLGINKFIMIIRTVISIRLYLKV